MELGTDYWNPNETETSGHITQCDGITNFQLYRVSACYSARSLRWPNLAVGCGCFTAVYLPEMQWNKNSRLPSLNIHYFNVYFFNLYLLCKCGKRSQCEIKRFVFASLPDYRHKINGRKFSNSSSSRSINKFLQLCEGRCWYLELLSFYLLAFPEISSIITCGKPYSLFCTKLGIKKPIGAYELIVAGLHKVPWDRQSLLNINFKKRVYWSIRYLL